jgi:hypothetical protein
MKEYEYDNFLTVTFANEMSIIRAAKSASDLLHQTNNKLFGREYWKRGTYLEGFSSYERHADGKPHFHMMLERNPKINKVNGIGLLETIQNCSKKFKTANGYNVFGWTSFDIEPVCDKDNLIEYMLKDFKCHDADSVSIITNDGIILQLH